MTSKTFVSGTVIDSAWLNDVNNNTYGPTAPVGTLRGDLAAPTGASLVTFGQSGTGAVPLSVQTVLRESVNIEHYGAVGALGTDDSAAINAAFAAANGRGVCGVLGKTYYCNNVSIPSGSTIYNLDLKSNPSSVIMSSVVLIDGITAPKSDIFCFNVTVDGNRDNHSAIAYPSSEDGGRHGWRVVGHVTDLTLSYCTGNNCATDGIELYSGGGGVTGAEGTYTFKNITLDHCTFNSNRRMGIAADSHNNLRITYCTTNGNGLPTALANTPGHTLNTDGSWAAWVVSPTVPGPSYGNGMDFEGYGMGSGFTDLYLQGNISLGNGGESYAIRENATPATITGFIPRGPLIMIGNRGGSGLSGGLTNGIVFGMAAGTLATDTTWKYVTMSANIIDGPVRVESILRLKLDSSNQIFCSGVAPLIRYCTEYTVAMNVFFDTTEPTITTSRSTLQNAAYQGATGQSFTASTDNIIVASAALFDPAFCVTGGTTFTARYAGTFRLDSQMYLITGGGTITLGYIKNAAATVPMATYTASTSYFAYQALDYVTLVAGDTIKFTFNPSLASTTDTGNAPFTKFAITQIG